MAQVGNDFSRNAPNFIVKADFYTNPATPRVPSLNEPNCGSCHTGDAVLNMTTAAGERSRRRTTSGCYRRSCRQTRRRRRSCHDSRFAEPRVTSGPAAGNPQLFRLSVDSHGGVFCEGCHGATHAEWPVRNANANDNVAAKQFAGPCGNGDGMLDLPHGRIHERDAERPAWHASCRQQRLLRRVVRGHEDFVERGGTARRD